MIDKQPDNRRYPAVVDVDSLVPKFHLLRKIDKSMDWNKIYELVEHLYSKNVGRPSIDPVVLIKIVLLQHLYGHRSLRQVVATCEDSVSTTDPESRLFHKGEHEKMLCIYSTNNMRCKQLYLRHSSGTR